MMRAEKEAGEVKPARKSLSPPKACIDHLSGAGYAPPEHSAKRPCEQGRPDAPARPLPTPQRRLIITATHSGVRALLISPARKRGGGAPKSVRPVWFARLTEHAGASRRANRGDLANKRAPLSLGLRSWRSHAALQARQVGHGDDIDAAQRDIDALDAVAVGAGRDDLQGLGRRSYLT